MLESMRMRECARNLKHEFYLSKPTVIGEELRSTQSEKSV